MNSGKRGLAAAALTALLCAPAALASIPSAPDLALAPRPLPDLAPPPIEATTDPESCGVFCQRLEVRLEPGLFGGGEGSVVTLDAWGNYRNPQELEASKNRFGFTGHLFDRETGTYYAKARYFDPGLGRFLTQDSYLGESSDPPSLHRYAYARSNPATRIDPTGHSDADANALAAAMHGRLGGLNRAANKTAAVVVPVGAGVAAAPAAAGAAGFTLLGGGVGFLSGFLGAKADNATVSQAVDQGRISALFGSIGGALGYAGGQTGQALAEARGWGARSTAAAGAFLSGLAGDAAAQLAAIQAGVQERFNYTQSAVIAIVSGGAGAVTVVEAAVPGPTIKDAADEAGRQATQNRRMTETLVRQMDEYADILFGRPAYDIEIGSNPLDIYGMARRGPKPQHTGPHNLKVDEIGAGGTPYGVRPGERVIAGGGIAPERLIPTPGGLKEGRRPDVLIETPQGNLRGVNVGKVYAGGEPVVREVDALRDLREKAGIPMDFVPYFPEKKP